MQVDWARPYITLFLPVVLLDTAQGPPTFRVQPSYRHSRLGDHHHGPCRRWTSALPKRWLKSLAWQALDAG